MPWYKIVNKSVETGKLVSHMMTEGLPYCVEYIPGEWTYPIAGSKLFVYKEWEEVEPGFNEEAQTWKCEIQGEPIRSDVYLFNSIAFNAAEMFWNSEEAKNILTNPFYENQHLGHIYLVDAVKLIERV